MSLTLFYHPLASFCWKVQIALYEKGTEFRREMVNLGDAASSARFFELWPVGKMPLLRDEERDRTVPETTIIIEYLDQHYPSQRACFRTMRISASTRAFGTASMIFMCRRRCSGS